MANGEIWKSSWGFGPTVHTVWLVLRAKQCCPLNLSLAKNRLPMGLLCEGSQNHSFCPQGTFDPKPSQERTKEHGANHHRQMCVHVCGLLQWRLGVCEKLWVSSSLQWAKPACHYFLEALSSVWKVRLSDIMGKNEAGGPENWVQVSTLLCVCGQDTGPLWR